MPSPFMMGVIGVIVIFFVVGIYFATQSGTAPTPVSGTPMPSPVSRSLTSPSGTPSSSVPSSPIPAPAVIAPNVIGLKSHYTSVGTVTNSPYLTFGAKGHVNTNVRVRGTSLTLPVSSTSDTAADVYAQFAAPFTGTVILEKTDGTMLSSNTVTNLSSAFFHSAVV